MAGWIWSNPDPSAATSAALSAPFHADAANIGPVLHALLEYQRQQQQEKDKQYSDLINGIAKGVSGAYGQYQQGQADDAANAAIYGMQNPGDQYGGFNNPDVVPDYGGQDALRALQYVRKEGGFLSPDEQSLMNAKIDAEQALAHNRWAFPPGGDSGDSLNDLRRLQIMQDAEEHRALGDFEKATGAKPQEASALLGALSNYSEGDTPFPTYEAHPVWDDTKDSSTKNAVLDAYKAYVNSVEGIRNRYNDRMLQSGGAVSPSINPTVSAGVRQSDVDQAKEAMSIPPAAIEYLRAHPELAREFEAKYGVSAQTYLH